MVSVEDVTHRKLDKTFIVSPKYENKSPMKVVTPSRWAAYSFIYSPYQVLRPSWNRPTESVGFKISIDLPESHGFRKPILHEINI